MPDEVDKVFHDALVQATFATLMGSSTVPIEMRDGMGNIVSQSYITIKAAFSDRLSQKARQGDFDEIINKAMEKVTVEGVQKVIEGCIADQFIAGLEPSKDSWGKVNGPGWLAIRAKEIATEAVTNVVANDEELISDLRERVGMEIDRNRIGITVKLSDPED